ncbi:MAG: HAD-IC family P-type ATPase [Acidimicrobiia bacterium]|nr:HAD-IC family P-type ATPase [Acidimicrobiia bacterium]
MTAVVPAIGLSSAEAARRASAGLGNEVEESTGRSLAGIVRANVLTRFNAIITGLMVVVLVFGSPVDALFAFVMVINSLIGIVQEVRAKRSLDALRVLIVPSIGVYRDGQAVTVSPGDVVLGDVIRLEIGDQIPVDGTVVGSEGLEVDESALTGESEPVSKPVGAEVLSGSFVVAGTADAEATRVGADSWVQQLTREAKTFVLTESELRVGVDRLLRVVGWILPFLSAVLLWSQLQGDAGLSDAMISTVAGVISLVPQGLVLLVSMALAVAVVRLAKAQVIVQELPSVEGLARIDLLCVDKTGTLTTGNLAVDSIEAVDSDGESDVRAGLAALAGIDSARSATVDALRSAVADEDPGWATIGTVPFSSVRKWSGAEFGGHGTWILGAPEVLLDAMSVDCSVESQALVRNRVDELTAQARRVLLLAGADESLAGPELPVGMRPLGLVALKEEVRPDAAETMMYFRRQNVEVKVISGDNPRTVAAVAGELGLVGADYYVDMRTEPDLETIPAETTVYGRVLPEQKRDLVRLFQARGHTVAMTGDGVNDIPSLKAADIGIAMNTATSATKSAAQLVLVDGRFDRLPGVVAEGRRVIANMERVSALFITKTVYAALLIVAVGVSAVPFPFLPRHLSLVAAVTIGVPAFALSFRSSNEPCRPGFLSRVMRFAVPAGVLAASTTFAAYGAARSPLADADLDQARTAAVLTLTLTGLWILYRLVRPLNRYTAGLFVLLATGFGLAVVPSPVSDFYALPLPPLRTTAVIVGALAVTIGLVQLVLMVVNRFLVARGHQPPL